MTFPPYMFISVYMFIGGSLSRFSLPFILRATQGVASQHVPPTWKGRDGQQKRLMAMGGSFCCFLFLLLSVGGLP